MSRPSQLTALATVASATITLPGAHQLTLVGLHWAGKPTDEEFRTIAELRENMARIDAWVDGDLAAEHIRREWERRPRASVRELCFEYAKRYASTPETVYDRYCVAEFYPFKHHNPRLSWSHHRVVWASGARPLHRALAWLAKAEEFGWPPDELRAALRDSKAPAATSEPELRGFFPPELQRAEDWCSGQLELVETIESDGARRLLESMPCIVEFVDGLRAALARNVRAGIKESIGAAS